MPLLEARRSFEQGMERARHRRDPVAFFTYVGPRLARAIHEPQGYQSKVLRSKSRRILLVAGRQCGKTSTLAALALHTALFERGRLVLLVTPTARQARILFARVARMYQAYGGTVDTLSARRMGFEFANGSQIEALPGNAAGIQGYDADLAVVDEGGFVSDELFDAITPSLAATGGRLVFAGRPNGKVGPFYGAWAHGEGWEKHLIRADKSPLISPEHLAAERKRMTVGSTLRSTCARSRKRKTKYLASTSLSGPSSTSRPCGRTSPSTAWPSTTTTLT
jgi:Terminase large subunit, T4likevirus-type, N-terminal